MGLRADHLRIRLVSGLLLASLLPALISLHALATGTHAISSGIISLHSSESVFQQEAKDKAGDDDLLPPSDPVYGGNLANGFASGSFSINAPAVYYSFTVNDDACACGVTVSAPYDVSISIYYANADYSHPFILGTNSVAFFPAFSNRTTNILLRSADPLHPAFSFSVAAAQTTTPTDGYMRYTFATKHLTLCSYASTVTDLNLPSVGNTTVSSSDLGTPDQNDLYPVVGTGSPYSSVAYLYGQQYYGSSYHGGDATAFRIRPNLFATNGHAVFNSSAYAFNYSATLYPGRQGSNYTSLSAVAFCLPVGYVFGTSSFDHDFALLETTGDTATDSLGMDATASLAVNDSLYMLGYPSPPSHSYYQQYSEGEIYDLPSGGCSFLSTIPADGNAYGGSSGSPVFCDGAVVGINNGSVSYTVDGVKVACYEHAVLFDSAIQSLVSTRLSALSS